MGCLSWPQKKALKLAFKLIERKFDNNQNASNQQQSQQYQQYQQNQPMLANDQGNQQYGAIVNPQNMKLAMNLLTKALDL